MVRGDRSAVAELYARHVRALHSLAQAMLKNAQEAEDLIQDEFDGAPPPVDEATPDHETNEDDA